MCYLHCSLWNSALRAPPNSSQGDKDSYLVVFVSGVPVGVVVSVVVSVSGVAVGVVVPVVVVSGVTVGVVVVVSGVAVGVSTVSVTGVCVDREGVPVVFVVEKVVWDSVRVITW